MSTILNILGIVFIVVIVIGICLFFYLRKKWRQLVEMAKDGDMPPFRVHLNEDLDPEWTADPEISGQIKKLEELGFAKGKAYSIHEMPGVVMASFFKPDEGLFALVNRHERGLVWAEFAVQYEDGNELSISNLPAGKGVDHRPEVKKLQLSDAGMEELYDALKKELEPKPKKTINDGNFREEFEKSYEKDNVWRMQKGGISKEEVRRMAEDGGDFDEETFEETLAEIKLQEIRTWHDACIEHLLEKKNAPAEKWDFYKDRFIIVSDLMMPLAFVNYLDERMEFTEEQYNSFRTLANPKIKAGNLFSKIHETLSPDLRPKKAGSINYPIQAEVYRLPEDL